MTHSFHVNKTSSHLKWDNSLKPVLAVSSGSTISFDLLDGGGNQVSTSALQRQDLILLSCHDCDLKSQTGRNVFETYQC